MLVTLRKASVLQKELQDALKGLKLTTNVEISEFQDVDAVLATSNLGVKETLKRYGSIVDALYSLRLQIGEANNKSGISALLTSAASIDKMVAFTQQIANAAEREAANIIRSKVEKLKNTPDEHRRYGANAVSASTVTSADIAEAKNTIAQLKKQKQKINDEVLALNIKTEIELTPEVVEVLQAEKLI